MLLEFSFANFLSFRDKVTISMVATALKDRKADIGDATFSIGEDSAIYLNRCSTVFGANASGKSNLVKALAFFKWFTLNSSKDIQAGEGIPVRYYALSSVSETEPSLFEIMLYAHGNTYRYGFEVNTIQVCREWLYIKCDRKRSKEIELFYRDANHFEIHPKFSIGRELADKNMVRDNALLLSLAGQFNDPFAKTVMKWLNDTTIITANSETEIWGIALKAMENPETRKKIVEFSRYADLGIDDISLSEFGVLTSHTQYDDNGRETASVTFSMKENESDGTVKYFSLAYPIIDTLEHGKRLIVDEFGSKLHTLLIMKVISLFNTKAGNPNNAQLLVTLQDTNLLSNSLLRRDQIWFTQKNGRGESELYSLSDYKVRSDASYEKDYLLGKYGATPIIDDLSKALRYESEV
ncbi:MAG: ATP/GTP-binding protein [Candidatus Cryptobacteroides sp.]